MQVQDRVFVVTGGGNGIGREVVIRLLGEGGKVAAVDLRAEALEGLRSLAGADRLSTHACDVSDEDAVRTLADEVVAFHGQVDGLLNVAGIIQRFVPFADLPREEMEKLMGVNFWGVVNTCSAFLPLLRERPEACVVNVSSMGGFTPVPGQTVYGASKAAVKLLTEGLYAEMRGTSVAVTVVFPGGVATGIADNSGAARDGMGDDIAKAAARLTTPQAAAEQIVDAVGSGAYRVVIGKDAKGLDVMMRLNPRRATDLIAKKMASLIEK